MKHLCYDPEKADGIIGFLIDWLISESDIEVINEFLTMLVYEFVLFLLMWFIS